MGVHRPTGTAGAPKFVWRASDDAPEEVLRVVHRVFETKTPWTGEAFSTQVAHAFLIEPGGKTLAQVAIHEGVWTNLAAAARRRRERMLDLLRRRSLKARRGSRYARKGALVLRSGWGERSAVMLGQ